MSQILGVGLTHYPGLLVPPENWPRMLKRGVEIGRIPADLYADHQRWPKEMLAEWGADEGVGAAREHERRLVAAFKTLRRKLDEFAPDLVLIWGDDQYENFRKDCIPAFCLYLFDELECRPYGGGRRPFQTTANAWGLPEDTVMRVRGHPEAADALCRHLLEQGFDIAYASETRAERGLAHSFNNTIVYLDRERKGFDYPVLPFHVNCYGNQILRAANPDASGAKAALDRSPPSPSPRRCFDIGRTTARFFLQSPWRVALIASSSWSHATLTAKHNRLYPDVAADRKLRDELRDGAFTHWGELPLARIEDAGQHEMLNWICLAGAMTELGQRPEIVDYVESYVFNSSKCFALFPSA
jgi:hypothetical protein